MALAPVLMGLVFLLPLETRERLAFRHAEPTVLTAFAANYVHFDVIHLLTNVASFLLVVAVIYVLVLLNGGRLRFYTVLGVILVGFPIPLSALTAAFPLFGRIVGFSGLSMAVAGFGLVELSIYLRMHFPGVVDGWIAPGFFFGTTTYIAAIYGDSTLALGLFAVSLALTVAYWAAYLSTIGSLRRWTTAAVAQAGYFEVLLVGAALLSVVAFTAFPRNPVTDTGTVNVYLHMTGFSLGFIAAYSWVVLTETDEDTSTRSGEMDRRARVVENAE